MNEIIQISNIASASVELAPDALIIRDELAGKAAQIQTVDSSESAQLAAAVLKDLSQAIREMENARKDVKKPVLELGRKIDALGAEFSRPLEKEKTRLSLIIGAWQAEEERKAREEAERIRKAEMERIRKAEEEKRKAEEAARSISFDAAFDAQEKIEESKNTIHDASETIVNLPKSAPKIEGARIVKYTKWEVVDAAALMRSHPELFSPDSAKISAYVKLISPEQAPAGLRVWQEAKASAR